MDLWIILILVGVGACVVIGIALAAYFDKKRTESLQQAAADMGLEFLPAGDSQLQDRLAAFQLFNQGRARKLRNLVRGDAGEILIAIFDYQYTTGSGKNSHTSQQTVAALQSAQLKIPAFSMRPEGLFDRLGSVFGSQDIDFESHPEFSRMFLLKSTSEEEVRKFFDDSILSHMETKKGLCLEAYPEQIIMYYASKRLKPHQLKSFLEEAYTVYGLFADRCAAAAAQP